MNPAMPATLRPRVGPGILRHGIQPRGPVRARRRHVPDRLGARRRRPPAHVRASSTSGRPGSRNYLARRGRRSPVSTSASTRSTGPSGSRRCSAASRPARCRSTSTTATSPTSCATCSTTRISSRSCTRPSSARSWRACSRASPSSSTSSSSTTAPAPSPTSSPRSSTSTRSRRRRRRAAPSPRSADDLYILYTGGTTGMPKGVMWRQEDIFFAALGGGNYGGPGIDTPGADRRQRHAGSRSVARARAADARQRAVDDVGHALRRQHRRAQHGPASSTPTRSGTSSSASRCSIISLVGDAMARPLVDALAHRDHVPTVLAIVSGGAILSPSIKAEINERLPERRW